MKASISGQALGIIRSTEEIFAFMSKRRIKAIELWPVNIPSDGGPQAFADSRYQGRDVAKVKALATRYGIEIACVTMPGAFDKGLASDQGLYAASLAHAVEVAHELGAKIVNHYVYHLCLEEDFKLANLLPYFEPAIRRAEQLGVTLALENEAHDAVRTAEGMLSMIGHIASPVFKTNFDATNYYHAGQEAFPHSYDVLKDHIAYIHVKNGCIFNPKTHPVADRKSAMSGHLTGQHIYYPTVANGAVNIDGLLCRVDRDGYKGHCTLEPHARPEVVEEYFEEELAYLRSRGFMDD